MSFSHVSRPLRTVTSKTFGRKFITLGRVINYWDQAVGPDLAAKTYPIGMKVRKAPAGEQEQRRPGPQVRTSRGPRVNSGRDLDATKIPPPGSLRSPSPPYPPLKGGDKNKEGGEVLPSPPSITLNATLEIAASSADATLIHYQKALILERLRTLLGADMITDIKVTHTTRPAPVKRKPAPPLTAQEKNSLSPLTQDIPDSDLRSALDSFAQSMTHPVL